MRVNLTTFLLGVFMFGRAQSRAADWSGRVVSKVDRPVGYWISPHINSVNVLIVDGKRYENVRGVDKFYMQLPNTNAILFIVDEKDQSVTYHIYDMPSKNDTTIHASNSVFGLSIGAKTTNRVDSIESGENGKIFLCTTFHNTNETTKICDVIDTKEYKLSSQVTKSYGPDGKIMRTQEKSPPF